MTAQTNGFLEFENSKYFPSLDGMRALCVLLVMFNHVHVRFPGWIIGWMGVDVFFVLSGFLITTLLLREKDRTGRVSFKGFYIRRFFRIIPVYLFTVLLYLVAVRVTRDPVKTAQFHAALPWMLTFMQEYRPAAAGNILGHAWTLGIEEKFYILWPLLLVALFPFRGRAVAWLCGLSAIILTFPWKYSRSYGGLLIGAILAIALSKPAHWEWVRSLPRVPDILLCLAVVGMYELNGRNNNFVLLFSLAIAFVIASLVLRQGLLRSVLENRVLVFIGKRSYAMYLIHVLVANAVEALPSRLLPRNWILVVGLAYLGSLAGASMMHVFIEAPCIRLGRRLSKRVMARDLAQAVSPSEV